MTSASKPCNPWWSRILAGEVAEPGFYSLRTLNAVRTLTRWDAEAFAHACRFVVIVSDGNPVIYDVRDYFTEHNLAHRKIAHLEVLGLLQGGSLIKPNAGGSINFSYDGKKYEIRIPADRDPSLRLGLGMRILSFTQIGYELRQLTDAMPVEGYIEAVRDQAKNQLLLMVDV